MKPQALLDAGLRELRLPDPHSVADLPTSAVGAVLTMLRAAMVVAALTALASLSTPAAHAAVPQAANQALL
ncbi:MAG: hypothetical protein JNN03_03205 [Rubrivivax sp.]|nr:hypothetical protein [Rubrivivax sp.]